MAKEDFLGVEILFGHKYTSTSTWDAVRVVLTQDILNIYDSIYLTSGSSTTEPNVGDQFSIEYYLNYQSSKLSASFTYLNLNESTDTTLDDFVWALNNSATGSQDGNFDTLMSPFIAADNYTGGLIVKCSPINEVIGEATEVMDGDLTTYTTIGKDGVRFILHDFGGNFDQALYLKKIKWVTESDVRKSYTVEAWDGGKWQILKSDTSIPGERKEYSFEWDTAQPTYAIRIYHRGDYETNSPSVELALSNVDQGAGTEAYKISGYSDFRDAATRTDADANGWITTTDGVVYIDWELIEETLNWELLWDSGKIITAQVKIDTAILFATDEGEIYYLSLASNEDSTSFNLVADLGEKINTLFFDGDYIYAGSNSGNIYRSSNGLSWSTTPLLTLTFSGDETLYEGVLSIASFDDKIYFGTDYFRLYIYDPTTNEIESIKIFSDQSIETLSVDGIYLYIGTGPSGRIFKHDGTTYSSQINTKLTTWKGSIVYTADGDPYFYGDRGTVYKLQDSSWDIFQNVSADNITSSLDFVKIGPPIADIYEDVNASGSLYGGNYLYAISYINYDDVESLIGPVADVDIFSDGNGSVKLSWSRVVDAKSFNIYRTIRNDQSELFLRRLKSGITEDSYLNSDTNLLDFTDIGTNTGGVRAPSTSDSQLWFGTDNGRIYVYNQSAMITMSGPSQMNLIDQINEYNATVLISSRADLTGTSKVYKFIGSVITSGTKRIYLKSKDTLGNESDTKYDDIYLNLLYEKSLLEIDEEGELLDVYESELASPLKIVSPEKNLYESGTYVSEPFYAETLSKWDKIQYLCWLNNGNTFDLYVRTADTLSDLELTDWILFATEENASGDEYYDQYDYSYEYEYNSSGYVSDFVDISTLKGKWIQFRIILKTSVENTTPQVYSIILRYITTNASYFYSNIFDLSALADSQGIEDYSNVKIRRGLLTYNGSIPNGGKIEFGITTETDSTSWQDYQIIEPNKRFEMNNQDTEFRVGIMLVSTPDEVAIVHEWGLTFDSGTNSVNMIE